MSILYDIEEWRFSPHAGNSVILSFETKYNGIWQCIWNNNGMSEFSEEPPFHTLTKDVQEEIQTIGPFVFYRTFGELPEHAKEKSL
jgi:hypothetical protein